MATDNYVHHLASAGPGKPLLFLFHGTGGDERQLLGQGVDAELAAVRRVATGVDGLPVLPDPLGHVQAAQLGHREIPDVVTAVAACAPREGACHVRDAVEVDVVQDDEFVVTGGDHVLLEEIGAARVRQRFSRERMLRQVTGRSPVRDDQRPRCRHDLKKR